MNTWGCFVAIYSNIHRFFSPKNSCKGVWAPDLDLQKRKNENIPHVYILANPDTKLGYLFIHKLLCCSWSETINTAEEFRRKNFLYLLLEHFHVIFLLLYMANVTVGLQVILEEQNLPSQSQKRQKLNFGTRKIMEIKEDIDFSGYQ